MLHSSNQVSNFARRPLTTPKPWAHGAHGAHGLQGEIDLKNLEPRGLAAPSPLKMRAAVRCSPLQPIAAQLRIGNEKNVEDVPSSIGAEEEVPALSQHVH